MTPEAQRITIAMVLPWKQINYRPGYVWFLIDDTLVELDPLSDLNAMHEAEKVLTLEQWVEYIVYIPGVTPRNMSWDKSLVHATAAQRAEAFLRTLNLWDDNK